MRLRCGSTLFGRVAELATRIFDILDRLTGCARHRHSESGHRRFARFDRARWRSEADSAPLYKKFFHSLFLVATTRFRRLRGARVRRESFFSRIATRRRRAREVRIPRAFLAREENARRNL